VPPLCHLTSCTPTKSNLYLANCLTTAVSEPNLLRLLTLHVPKLMFHFHCLGRNEASDQVGASSICFVTRPVFQWGFVSTLPNPQAGGPHLVGCSRLLIQYIRRYPLYWWSFLHPQPQEAPFRDYGDSLMVDDIYNFIFKIKHVIQSLSASPLVTKNSVYW
jgi:hypothetical protein